MTIKLGLIGDNIGASRSPLLHRLAGQQNGVQVAYNRLIPKELGLDFDAIFASCPTEGFVGINVTYPYKEVVAKKVHVEDPLTRAVGACNTVIFGGDVPQGYNTDHSGFMAAYRNVRGDAATGPVLMIGTGGVGRAVAFGLAGLGTTELRLVDRDRSKAEDLAAALQAIKPEMRIDIYDTAEDAAQGACGLINCTPVGMVGYEGTPVAIDAMAGAEWAFDAVYTPVDTQFLQGAEAHGLSIISGWELFFYQGVHAWKLFTGLPLDEVELRRSLIANADLKDCW